MEWSAAIGAFRTTIIYNTAQKIGIVADATRHPAASSRDGLRLSAESVLRDRFRTDHYATRGASARMRLGRDGRWVIPPAWPPLQVIPGEGRPTPRLAVS